jgi:hypothetical protein
MIAADHDATERPVYWPPTMPRASGQPVAGSRRLYFCETNTATVAKAPASRISQLALCSQTARSAAYLQAEPGGLQRTTLAAFTPSGTPRSSKSLPAISATVSTTTLAPRMKEAAPTVHSPCTNSQAEAAMKTKKPQEDHTRCVTRQRRSLLGPRSSRQYAASRLSGRSSHGPDGPNCERSDLISVSRCLSFVFMARTSQTPNMQDGWPPAPQRRTKNEQRATK